MICCKATAVCFPLVIQSFPILSLYSWPILPFCTAVRQFCFKFLHVYSYRNTSHRIYYPSYRECFYMFAKDELFVDMSLFK